MDPAAQGTILADALLIERVVRRFEDAWRNGENPTVESYLDSLPATHRSIAHERLHAAAHRLMVEEGKREQGHASLAATYLHDTSQLETKNSELLPASTEMPKQLGAFRLDCELGRGAFGIVYQAYDSRLDRKVAIKVPLLDSEKSRQQYIDEARKAAIIECVGIVPVYHVDVNEHGAPYVVQKFIDGPNLRSLLQRVGGIGLRPALTIVRDVARALASAHRRGMIHRDLKPENILLDKEGIPWIADFGLALREEEQDGRAGEVAGTPLYMSPEQVRGKADWLDGRTDIWAAGVLLYELIAGRPPFTAKSVERLIREICRRDPKPLSQRSAEIPVELDEIFSRCCAKKTRDRFASADELANQLDQILQSLPVGETGLSGGSSWESSGGSNRSALSLPARLSGPGGSVPTAAPATAAQAVSGRVPTGQVTAAPSSVPQQDETTEVAPPRSLRRQWMGAGVLTALSAVAMLYSLSGRGWHPRTPLTSKPADELRDALTGDVLLDASREAIAAEPEVQRPPDVLLPAEPPEPMVEPQVIPPPAPVAPPLYLTVSPDGTGTHRTIADALQEVDSGGEIRIGPGFYSEVLRITKPVQLLGGEDRAQVVIQSLAGPCLTIDGGTLSAERITFRGMGVSGQHEFNTIDILDGSLQLTDCDVSASTFCCIKARKGTLLSATDSGFTALSDSAISCRQTKPVSLSGCTFRDCKDGAAIELMACTGTVAECHLLGNNQYGIYCEETGETAVRVRDCKWEGCGQAGIKAGRRGWVDVEGGSLSRCKVSIEAQGGSVRLHDVRVEDGTGPCMSVTQQGQVEATDCEFRACMVGLAMEGAEVKLTNCLIAAMTYMGVYTKAGSRLECSGCRIEGSREAAMQLVDTQLTLRGGWVSENGAGGIYASGARTNVTAHDLTIDNNSKIGFHLTDGSASFVGGSISRHAVGVLVERSPDAAKATQFDAERLTLRNNSLLAFQFLAGTEGDLRGCQTMGHPPNKALLVSVDADVLTDDACKFEQ